MPKRASEVPGQKSEVGHGASRDDTERYREGQEQWQSFVTKSVQQISQGLNNQQFEYFHEVFAELAKGRASIAKDIGQQPKDKRKNQFGLFPSENRRSFEQIARRGESDWSAWKNQAPAITAHIEAIVAALGRGESISGISVKRLDTHDPDERELDRLFETEGTDEVWIFEFKSPKLDRSAIDIPDIYSAADHVCDNIRGRSMNVPESTDAVRHGHRLALFKVAMKEGKVNGLLLEYPSHNAYLSLGDYLIADQLFKDLNKWTPEDGLEEFKRRAAKLAHFTCHHLFIERGTASVAEIMLQGIAQSKGIDLGNVGQREDIGWAWKALVTPDADQYATWFQSNAYMNAKVLTATAQDDDARDEAIDNEPSRKTPGMP
jgi:hypothetical protein